MNDIQYLKLRSDDPGEQSVMLRVAHAFMREHPVREHPIGIRHGVIYGTREGMVLYVYRTRDAVVVRSTEEA